MTDEENTNFLISSPKFLSKIKINEYQVVIGISGFGNVGFLALTHMIETLPVKSIAYWGDSSWFYKGNIEALVTAYMHESSKSIFVVTRAPIHVSSVPQRFWDAIVRDLMKWQAKKYIVIGGLRESTRSPQNSNWVAYAPTRHWMEKYGHTQQLNDKLLMIGPLSSVLLYGSAFEVPALGMLVYSNFEEDPEATIVALNEIEKLCDIRIPEKKDLKQFDYSFLPSLRQEMEADDEDLDDDESDELPGFVVDRYDFSFFI